MIRNEASVAVFLLDLFVRLCAISSTSESHIVAEVKYNNRRTNGNAFDVDEGPEIHYGRISSLDKTVFNDFEKILQNNQFSERKVDNDKKSSIGLGTYLNMSKFEKRKSPLSKHQQNHKTNRHKHRKHHHRYRHTKRKKIDNFPIHKSIPQTKKNIADHYFFTTPSSPLPSIAKKYDKFDNGKDGTIYPKSNRVVRMSRRKLVQNIIDNFNGKNSTGRKSPRNKLSLRSDPPSWLVSDLTQERNQSKETEEEGFSPTKKDESNSISDRRSGKGISVRDQSIGGAIKLIIADGLTVTTYPRNEPRLNFDGQKKDTRLNTNPFLIPEETTKMSTAKNGNELSTFFDDNHLSKSPKNDQIFPNASSVSFVQNEVETETQEVRSPVNERNTIKSSGEVIAPDHVSDKEAAGNNLFMQDNPTDNFNDAQSYSIDRHPLRLFINNQQNIRIRKSKEHFAKDWRDNHTTPEPPQYSIILNTYKNIRSNRRLNKTKGFVLPTNYCSGFSYTNEGRNFPTASELTDSKPIDHHEPCYSIHDIFLVILMTSLVNLLAGIVLSFVFCCLPLRDRCFPSYAHYNQGGCSRNHQEEDNSGSVGCLEACLPDISYQRHIARGFSKGRAFGMAHMFQQLTGSSSGDPCIWDRKPRKLRKDSLMSSRRSLSLEDISAAT